MALINPKTFSLANPLVGTEVIPVYQNGWKTIDLDSVANLSQGVNGGVFITDIQPTSTGNVGDKVYSSSGIVLDECTTDTDLIDVSVLAITGNTNYIPVITVNGTVMSLDVDLDKPVFTGTISIDITGLTEVVVVHEDGATHTAIITKESAPLITSLTFTGSYPGSQTELKAGDTFQLTVTTDVPVIAIEIADFGACVYSSTSVAPNTTHIFNGIVANRGTTQLVATAQVRVQKASGSWSAWATTTNYVLINNLYPSVSIGSITYPIGQGALKDAEEALVANTCSNFDSILYSSPNGEVTVSNSTTYEAKTVTRASGTYNISITNFRITCTRNANGAVTTGNAVVKIANTACTASVSFSSSRLRSGGNAGTAVQNHICTLVASQQLISSPSMNAPEGTWTGSFTGSGTTWTRTLQVHDNDAKGVFSFNSISVTNLAGIETTTLSSGTSYTIGGFVFRTLTVPAYPVRQVVIGTEVINTAKLRCTNLSKGASGSLNFTYQATQDEAIDKYTVLTNDTWYNCDGANASSNTTGTMQIELEEVV